MKEKNYETDMYKVLESESSTVLFYYTKGWVNLGEFRERFISCFGEEEFNKLNPVSGINIYHTTARNSPAQGKSGVTMIEYGVKPGRGAFLATVMNFG